MNGHIHEHPLVELIREISVTRLSGALRLQRERVKTVVYFADGELVYAASNLRIYKLAECLSRWGMVDQSKLQSLASRDSDLELAIELVTAGILKEQEAEQALARQLTEVLQPSLLWTEGTWEFDARVRLVENSRPKIDVRLLSIEAARHLPSEFVVTRLRDSEEKLFPEPLDLAGQFILPLEGFVLSRIDGPMSIGEVLATGGLPDDQTLRALYVLLLGSCLKRDGWVRAFTDEELAKARTAKTSLSQRAAARPRQEPAQKHKEIPVVDKDAEMKELQSLFQRLSTARNYYEVLDVSSVATEQEIKRSYHWLARRFHPDRFHQQADATLHSRVEAAFARIAQAYDTLRDKKSRGSYDLKLEMMKKQTRPTAASSEQRR
jgi:hypothetical protein